jgi:hypothetical protein
LAPNRVTLLLRKCTQKFIRDDSSIGNSPRMNMDRRDTQSALRPRAAEDHVQIL